MREVIRKILKESDELDWIRDSEPNVPLDEITDWIDTSLPLINKWVQKIHQFNKQSPQMAWNGETEFSDLALSVKSIGDELSNIYSSFETIDGEVEFIKNPNIDDE
jgi:hypothetical protein